MKLTFRSFVVLLMLITGQTHANTTATTTIREKLISQEVIPLQTPAIVGEESTISAAPVLTNWQRVLKFAQMCLSRSPSLAEVRAAQLESLESLESLKAIEAFDLLMMVSNSRNAYSHTAQWKSREILQSFIPYMSVEQRQRFLSDLKLQKNYFQDVNHLADGRFGDWTQLEIQRYTLVIDEVSRSIDSAPYLTVEQNAVLQNYRMAFMGAISVPFHIYIGVLETLFDNPLLAPTRIAGSLATGIWQGLVQIPNNLVGIVTAGRYGNAGKTLGQSTVNSVLVAFGLRATARAGYRSAQAAVLNTVSQEGLVIDYISTSTKLMITKWIGTSVRTVVFNLSTYKFKYARLYDSNGILLQEITMNLRLQRFHTQVKNPGIVATVKVYDENYVQIGRVDVVDGKLTPTPVSQ